MVCLSTTCTAMTQDIGQSLTFKLKQTLMLQAVASISMRAIGSEAEQGGTIAPVRIADVIQQPVVAVVLIVHWGRLHLQSTIGP